MDVIVRSNSNQVNDMTASVNGLINRKKMKMRDFLSAIPPKSS